MDNLPIATFLIVTLLLVCIFAFIFWRIYTTITQKVNTVTKHLNHANHEIEDLGKQILEMRTVAIGLGQKVNMQDEVLLLLTQRIKELEQVDTEARLYSRANKMVQLGADLNELINECELPKAEAELMLSLQKKMSGEEKMPSLDPEENGFSLSK